MQELKDYQEMINKCSKCGNCQYYCPTFRASRLESYVARGRIELAAAALDGRIQDYSETFVKRMNQCLLCGNCSQFCPPGVESEKIITAMRGECIKQKGVSGVLAHVKKRVDVGRQHYRRCSANRCMARKYGTTARRPKDYDSAEIAIAGCVPTLSRLHTDSAGVCKDYESRRALVLHC